MVTVGLRVSLTAKPGKESELEQFLRSALPLVEREPATAAALMERATDLLAAAPEIEQVDVLAAKLPANSRD